MLLEFEKEGSDFDTGVKNAIVSAIKHLESKFYFLFNNVSTVTISSGSNATNLPADFKSLASISYVSNSTTTVTKRSGFRAMPFGEMINLFENGTDTGLPQAYSIWGDQLYVFPYVAEDTVFTLYYYTKDIFYPSNDNDSSLWFNDETIDAVRYKASEIFVRDTLQTPELAPAYQAAFNDWANNLTIKNNQQQQLNVLSI
jgi:hypothetical protein